jgi:formate dehydrogenase iron-sulfur subunit
VNVGILTDLTKCIGCGACAAMCKQINQLPGPVAKQLDAYTWTVVERRKGIYVRRQCLHCLEPTCASVCPVAALSRTSLGAVTYDSDKCIGCRYCVMACPFDIPKYQWDSPVPIVGKCILCIDKRLRKNEEPACTGVCPAGATVFFADRNEMLDEARRRIRNNPGKYVNHIYGEKEAAGTSVMYLSPMPFRELAFQQTSDESYPELTWRIIEKIPAVVSVGGVTLFGLMWVINRRIEMKRKALEEAGKGKE